jgi:hypothetical protein
LCENQYIIVSLWLNTRAETSDKNIKARKRITALNSEHKLHISMLKEELLAKPALAVLALETLR